MFSIGDRRLRLWTLIPLIAGTVAIAADVAWAKPIDAPASVHDVAMPNGPDDALPTLSIDDLTVNEPDSTATFTITREGRTNKDVSFDIATSDVDATAGLDYTSRAGRVTIPRSGKTKTARFTVPILEDDIDELYDLQNDPGEMDNLINNPEFDEIELQLRTRLELKEECRYNPDRDWWLRQLLENKKDR